MNVTTVDDAGRTNGKQRGGKTIVVRHNNLKIDRLGD